jgi:uncharacterized RDD family membrane protein YckC
MICSNCKKIISKESKFCRFCGSILSQNSSEKSFTTNQLPVMELPNNSPVEESYAGFWIRLMAYIVDIGMSILVAISIAVILILIFGEGILDQFTKYPSIYGYILIILYNIFFLSTWSTTPGKAMCGLRVVYKNSRENISFITSILRTLLQLVSSLLWGWGYWGMKTDGYSQAFHDKKTGTVVLRRKKSLVLPIILFLGVLAILIWGNSLS